MEQMSADNLYSAAVKFKHLHEQKSLFVMPCAWDAFSAILFEQAGFNCIGTTSGGVNWVQGRKDYVYSTPRDEMLRAYGKIAQATSLPVSGDLENGYGSEPDEVAQTIRQSVSSGMVGGSIEDQNVVPTDDDFSNGKLFEFDLAVERIRAARSAADSMDIPYTLTARCEVYYTSHDKPIDESIKRLNAYREAGADCLFVPGLNDLDLLKQLANEVDGPVSFGMGATPSPITVTMLEDIGIKRVSTGGGLTRAMFAQCQKAARAIQTDGTFGYLEHAISESQVNRLLKK